MEEEQKLGTEQPIEDVWASQYGQNAQPVADRIYDCSAQDNAQDTTYNTWGDLNSMQGARSTPPQKPKSRVPGVIVLVIGIILAIVGAATLFFGGQKSSFEENDPIDVYEATATDQYVYTPVQYMTESIVYYEAMESMQFYIAIDSEWNMSVVCMYDDAVAQYQPYIDWLYSDSYEGAPEETMVVGYAQPYGSELKQLVVESYQELFEDDTINFSNFEDYFGEYYIQMGESAGAYKMSTGGILVLLLALVLIVVGGVMLYRKPEELAAYMGSPIVREYHTGRGILGAFLGAALGGLLWTIVNVLGFISGWIGILIIFFAYVGYKVLSHKEDTFGMVISFVFALFIVIPATYLAWGWTFYQVMNESIGGYTSLVRAMTEMPAYMSANGIWGDFLGEIGMGYLFMIIAGVIWLSSSRKK